MGSIIARFVSAVKKLDRQVLPMIAPAFVNDPWHTAEVVHRLQKEPSEPDYTVSLTLAILGLVLGIVALVLSIVALLAPTETKPARPSVAAPPSASARPAASIDWSHEFQLAAQCDALGGTPVPGFREPIVCVKGVIWLK